MMRRLLDDAWESTLADSDRGVDAGRAVRVCGDAKIYTRNALGSGGFGRIVGKPEVNHDTPAFMRDVLISMDSVAGAGRS
jgi:hypothetical protein